MANTYTTSWFSVSNGDSTTHNPGSLVSTNRAIEILSAQIQWEGEQTSSTSCSTNYDINTNSVTAQATTDSTTVTDSDSATATRSYDNSSDSNTAEDADGISKLATFPDVPSGSTFSDVGLSITIDASASNSDVNVDYADLDGNIVNETMPAGTSGDIYSKSTTIDHTGENRSLFIENLRDDYVKGTITATTTWYDTTNKTAYATAQSLPSGYNFGYINVKKYENGSLVSNNNYSDSSYVGDTFFITSTDHDVTVEVVIDTNGSNTNSDTASTSYPSVPNGYSFSRHYYREEKNGNRQDYDYIYSNKVGNSRSVTSYDPDNTWDLKMQTQGEDTNCNTAYYDTQDPSVSGDVSGSYNGTLNNGETSSWQTLSGLTAGDNTFDHSISQSNEAQFRFEFDWQYEVPTALAVYRVVINGTTYDVAMADPSDSSLEYDCYRAQVDGEGILALDVVSPSDANAIPAYVYHPTYGKLALREKV